MTTIGFIGLGTMGGPMARNVLKKGFPVKGFDLNPAAREKHREAGGTLAASPREAAKDVDILITMLPDGPDVEKAVLGEDGAVHGLKAGAIVIDMSTIDPSYTRRIGNVLAERRIAMIDSPVGKTADHAIAGTLTLIVGGDEKVVEKVRPVLDCMGTDFFYCGGLGMGEAMKLANNFLANTILSATSEALVMGVKAGLSLETMMSVMKTTMAWNNQLGVSLPKKALNDDFSLGFMVRLAEKDHRLAVQMAKSLDVETPVGSAAFDVLKQASGKGFADLDVSAVLRFREDQAGVKVRLAKTGQ